MSILDAFKKDTPNRAQRRRTVHYTGRLKGDGRPIGVPRRHWLKQRSLPKAKQQLENPMLPEPKKGIFQRIRSAMNGRSRVERPYKPSV